MSEKIFTRVLGLHSKESLELWPAICLTIDEMIDFLNLELSEEKIFFFWDNLLEVNHYFVGRPVIGVVKELSEPWRVKEVTLPEAPAFISVCQDWNQLLTEIKTKFPKRSKAAVVLNRLLRKDLELRIEVFFID